MRIPLAIAVLGIAAAASPAAFTVALGSLQGDLTAASAGLAGLTDHDSVLRKKAVDRSLAAVLAYSPSLLKDLATSVKVSKFLERVYPPGDALLGTLDGALDGLEVAVVADRDTLAEEASLLTGTKKSAADSAVASVDGTLVLAGLSSTRAARAGLLKQAGSRSASARRALRKGAAAGYQGVLNGSFETPGATIYLAEDWIRTGIGPAFGNQSVNRRTAGTATHRIADVLIDGENGGASISPHVASLSQAGVLLSRSSRLLFDYTVAANVAHCTSGPSDGLEADCRLDVLFSLDSPSVTVPLWSRSFPGGVTNESVPGQAIDLPFLPSAGTLIFRVTTSWVTCAPGGSYPQGFTISSDLNITLDNIRVE